MKNSKGACTGMCSIVRAERHFACSGTKQLRAILSLFRCDLYRGRRQADYLRRSAVLIQSSVGDLSCSLRVNVDKEFRLMLSGSGPRFKSKEISTGALAVRRVGKMFHEREFADVLLRHQLQSGSRIKTFLNRFQCDVQLRGCVLGQMLRENAKRCGLQWRTSCMVPTSRPGGKR